MIEVAVSSAAEGDFAEALSWYAERSIQAAERFDMEINHAVQMKGLDGSPRVRVDRRA